MGFFKRLKTRITANLRRSRRTRQGNFRDYRRKSSKARVPKRQTQQFKKEKKDRAKARLKTKLGKLWYFSKIGLALLAGIAAIYVMFFTRTFEVQEIQVEGGLDTEAEQAAMRDYLQSQLGENLLRFNPGEHELAMEDAYPHIKRVRIQRKFFHSIYASLESYPEIANIHVKNEDGSSSFYIVNEQGFISSEGNNEQLPTLVMDTSGTDPIQEGAPLMDMDTLETLLNSQALFEAKFGMDVLEVHYIRRAREVHLLTERYFFVWIDLQQDLELQLLKLKKALTELDIYAQELEYIDLRISGQQGEKVIYKPETTES